MWAVASRTSTPDLPLIAGLLDDGVILRTHVLRPTWHFVLPEDLGWLGDLCRPRLLPLVERQLTQHGIVSASISRGVAAIADAVATGPRTRRERSTELADAGLVLDGQRMMLLAAAAEMSEAVCSGPLCDGVDTYASFSLRVPATRRLDRDDALAELAFQGNSMG